jgi:hypothetical protein
VKVDKRIIEPFNVWWRKSNHCEPDPKAIGAFEAGFKAALEEVRKAGWESDLDRWRRSHPSGEVNV